MEVDKILDKIYKDCLELEKSNDLTDFGKGQLTLMKILKNF